MARRVGKAATFANVIAADLVWWQQRWEKSGRRDHVALLGMLNVFTFRHQLPLPVLDALREALNPQLPSMTKPQLRHHWACAFLEAGVGWKQSFEEASELLKGTSAKGGPDVIETDYKVVERSLPPEQRRRRTYRPKPPLR